MINNLSELQSKISGIDTPAIARNNVFEDRNNFYVNYFNLFVAYFNAIPNFIHEIKIDCKKANKWFLENYESEIKDLHFTKGYFKSHKNSEYDEIFYVLYADLVIHFDISESKVRFLFRKTDMAAIEAVILGIKKFKTRRPAQKSRISLLIQTPHSAMEIKSLQVTKPKLNIADNYNDDFQAIHQIIYKRLSQKNDKGLVLLHGKPGTGKTSYIRYLVSMLKKEVIFLPPSMAANITHPSLISVLINHPNSIFVIEDAENIVVDREKDGNSPVSALLNISDGLLSDCLNIQIICSFNTDISKIDSALMRKGRLIAKYEFKELETGKAKMLSKKLGFETEICSPMTLAGVYNQEEIGFEDGRKWGEIGFRAKA